MSILATIDHLNFERILRELPSSSRVEIATYNFDYRDNSRLLRAIRSLEIEQIEVVTGIPDCRGDISRADDQRVNEQIRSYYRAMNPARYRSNTKFWISHRNHAKIICCDHIAYLGSANFSAGSEKNFEIGYLTEKPEEIRDLRKFLSEIRSRSIPYFKVDVSLHLQKLMQFAADTDWIASRLEEHCYEIVSEYGNVDGRLEFSLGNFGVPEATGRLIKWAAVVAADLEKRQAQGNRLAGREERLIELGLTNSILHLSEELESITEQTELEPELSQAGVESSLLEKYALRDDPGSDPEMIEEATEIVIRNREQRYGPAKRQMEIFIADVRRVGEQIFDCLRV
ncbi:phospholipase D-like domain-containing protein [Opitutus terrae]|uniref:PLD phosphodiesterase domain-containing protein n=1 Tax=Opitutus terrae (strain DSM 11246 / JCM 15787 / PB90-1) TaxID=452637 RepID=B1ZXT0_OPITP|nr:phospholipase D-like domain-containing protein [Opitutus terrae]ACB74314.1 hypothetical protein Oter_1026 [Opitutus terrae PB90-1]